MCKLFALLENDFLYTSKETEIKTVRNLITGGQLTPSFKLVKDYQFLYWIERRLRWSGLKLFLSYYLFGVGFKQIF